MSALQWALLIFAVLAIVAVYLYSRRDRRAMDRWQSDERDEPLLPPRDQQLDIFAGGQFDEFGVGKPRRVAPRIQPLADHPSTEPAATPQRSGGSTRVAPSIAPAPPVSPAPPPVTPPAAAPMAPPAQAQIEEKIVALLIAERDGGQIPGAELHAALQAQGLSYGDRQIYHRLYGDSAVFSIASLVKPGYLDPQQADQFATPGLTVFMVLPGPQQPAAAIRDMLATAGRLANALNAQVYDAKRKPLTPNAGRDLQLEVESWARRHHIG